MPLTPRDIDAMAFQRPAVGSRGYHEGEVDLFLEDVAEEMRRLAAENQALAEHLQYGDMVGHLRRLEKQCAEAEERARALEDELLQARLAARSVTPPSAPVDPRMMEMAERTADQHMAEARRETEALLRKATTEAALIVSDAELRASTIVADARHTHAETIAGLGPSRDATLKGIDDLCQMARRYREALADDMARRLHDLTGGAPGSARA
ncbi:DivIVA domain-containing protein [Actinoplanes sp. NPDC051851]|uniref:DivIVA domain-containing protein n=1 Tax=Actinoplanes sp. NPDC051851 TaxID=3154753 RepID=UPI003426821A